MTLIVPIRRESQVRDYSKTSPSAFRSDPSHLLSSSISSSSIRFCDLGFVALAPLGGIHGEDAEELLAIDAEAGELGDRVDGDGDDPLRALDA